MIVESSRLTSEVRKSRLVPGVSPGVDQLLGLVNGIRSGGSVYYCVGQTPEQFEDIFAVLVDDSHVVRFELKRGDPDAEPTDVEVWPARTYRSQLKGIDFKSFGVALELARRDLAALRAR